MGPECHNRLNPSAAFGELSAHGVAEPVRRQGRTALAIDQPGLAATTTSTLVSLSREFVSSPQTTYAQPSTGFLFR
jgi:hypothetical protein